MVKRLFLAVPWGSLRFVIVVFPDHTHLLFLSAKKVMYAIFFSVEGLAIKVLVEKGKSITRKYYKDVVLIEIKKLLSETTPCHWFKHIHLLHDNAPVHTAAIVTAFLKKEEVTILPYFQYSLDLPPCDFFMFSKLK